MEELEFTRVCHLGRSTLEDDHDQRLAVDQLGRWYLYDWSGNSPATTDDGPLRVLLGERVIVDGIRRCIVVVEVVREGNRHCQVSVRPSGVVKMLDRMRLRGEEHLPTVQFAPDYDLSAIVALASHHKQPGKVKL